MSELIKTALSQYGIEEWKGNIDNPEVIKYFDDIGFDGKTLKDETAWCSAFVNWVCMMCDLPYTKKLNARSWLDIGEQTDSPEQGDIVVLWRGDPDGWKGHVGFYVRESETNIYMLGGNQGNKVQIAPYSKSRLLKYIRVK
tara:strand:+ start:1298 stop:1720 length:423 start_codon:yes stop_codon:yes gene_type:complete